MKKIILIVSLIMSLIMSGCGLYNLSGFVVPNDIHFLECVESLDTPGKLNVYMREHFSYETHFFYAPNPYEFWKLGEGDCNDFATFVNFVLNHHGYETWLIKINWKNSLMTHYIGAYKEGNYKFFDNMNLIEGNYITLKDIVDADAFYQKRAWKKYKVYDYNNNLIETGEK